MSPLTDKELAAQTIMGHNPMAVPPSMPTTAYWASSKTKPLTLLRRKQPKTLSGQGGRPASALPAGVAGCYGASGSSGSWYFAAEAYTGSVLRAFSDEMEAVIALAFFIPLLDRHRRQHRHPDRHSLSARWPGQVRFRDVPAVLAKELSTACWSASLAAAAVVRA